MRIASLHTYPVKGCHRLDHDEAGVEPWGLVGDRRWIVIDPDGVGITQRVTARLALLSVAQRRAGLTLTAPGMPALDVDEPADGPKEFIRVFRGKPPAPARLAPHHHRALGEHRRSAEGLLFGMNLIPDVRADGRGVIRVGDDVRVLP